MMFIPKLYIKYAYPLDTNRRRFCVDKNLGPYPSMEEVKARVRALQDLWVQVNANDRIFKLLIDLTGTNVPRDLELYVFGTGLTAMSNPLMMPIVGKEGVFTDDHVIETMIHEIAHRFVGDGENNQGIEEYWRTIREEYSQESVLTQNHVIIYAILEQILTEVFGKEGLPRFLHPKHPDYQRALALAHQKGAQACLQQFKSFLKIIEK